MPEKGGAQSAEAALHEERAPRFLLPLFALVCAGLVLAASLRHTGSLAFPIDDGYIYSNYVLNASQGHFFTYNPGEASGGITGIGWYALCLLAYWLLSPFGSLLGGLAPAEVRAASESLAGQAGHLYLAAYLPGVVMLALTALAVRRIALAVLAGSADSAHARSLLALLLGAVAAADLGLVWGALSGLEIAMSAALVAWSLALLLEESRRGVLRWSPVVGALLPLARPDLLAFSLAALLWLVLRALRRHTPGWRGVFTYALAVTGGVGLMAALYWLGWGRPLPSSFYAKVGGLRLWPRLLAAPQELLLAGRTLPFVGGALALLGGLAGSVVGLPRSSARGERLPESAWGASLLTLGPVAYVVALMITLPWFGQEDRYLLPVHPPAIVLMGLLAWAVLGRLPFASRLGRGVVRTSAVAGLLAVMALGDYVWASRNYAVEVRNMRDAHVIPALWIRANTPQEAVVASEPIGAVRLFAERRTVDLVGLTTPATLGTYRNWPKAQSVLQIEGAEYLLFYRDWFDDGEVPTWANEVERFEIPDNRIAGASTISIFRLDWSRLAASR